MLPADIASTLIGSGLLFASFDQKASKIAAIPLFVHLTIAFLWARHSRFTLFVVTFIKGLILIFYIVAHAIFLLSPVVVTAVEGIRYGEEEITVPVMGGREPGFGMVASAFFHKLRAIQFGEDNHEGWSVAVV
ncbi:hypothetical protein NBRC10512v2_004184 [Rhodotorula toruloides]